MNFFKRLFARRFDANATATQAAEAYKKALGPDLVGVLAFGSWAVGEYVEGHSDLNLVVVVKRLDAEVLKRATPVTVSLQHPMLTVRFFIQSEMKRFAEAFPLEFQDMAESRKLLAGEDPFARLDVPSAHLAFELLSESRVRLIKFRQKLVQGVGMDLAAARVLVGSTLGAILPLLRGLIRLKKRKPPKQRVRVIEEACKLFRLSRRTLLQAHDIKYGRKNADSIDAIGLLERLREELERLAELCAKLHEEGGGSVSAEGGREGRNDRGDREGRGEREGRSEGRDREGGRDRDHRSGGEHRGRDRDRDHGGRRSSGLGGDKNKRLAEVRQLIIEAGMKKRWEPKEPERFLSDDVARDSNLGVGIRFAWDRAWQPDRRKKGYVPPKPVEVEVPSQSQEEAWADEAAEISAQAAEEAASVEAPQPEAAQAGKSATGADAAEDAGDGHVEERLDRDDDPLIEEKL
jgi:hypothetical protein